jgi:hypothetical protein
MSSPTHRQIVAIIFDGAGIGLDDDFEQRMPI